MLRKIFSFRTLKSATGLGSLSIANLVLTFVFQIYVVASIGPGRLTDAFFAATVVPNVLVAITTGPLAHVLVPLLAGEERHTQSVDIWTFATVVFALFAPLGMLLVFTLNYWLPVIQPGFDDASLLLSAQVARLSLISMIFTALATVQTALYLARSLFIRAEMATLAANSVALLCLMWLLPRHGIIGAALANLVRAVLQSAFLLHELGRPQLPQLQTPAVKSAWVRVRPVMMGASYYKLEPILDRLLLTLAPPGALSLYSLGQQIYSAAGLILQKTIAAPLVTRLTLAHKQGDSSRFAKMYHSNLAVMTGICLCGGALFILCGKQALELIMGYRQIDPQDIALLWTIMVYLMGAFVGTAAGHISTAAFYATGDARSPAMIGIWTFTLYVPMKILIFHVHGVAGLAVAASVFVLANFALQHARLRRTTLAVHLKGNR